MSNAQENKSRLSSTEALAELLNEANMQVTFSAWKAELELLENKYTCLKQELEKVKELHRMQLVACSSATFANTKESMEQVENCHDDFKTAAFKDVCNSVKREMLLIEANKKLRDGLEKVIEMNLQTARDKYGDKNKAEDWSCVRVCRAALSEAAEIERAEK